MWRARKTKALAALWALFTLGSCAPPKPTPAFPEKQRASKGAQPSPTEKESGASLNAQLAYTLDASGPRPSLPNIELEKGERGFLIDGARVVVGPNGTRKILKAPHSNLNAFTRIPIHLGGGFLFRTSGTLYRASSFDGPLNPIVSTQQSISNISFGPKSILIRSSDGDRISLEMPDWNPAAPAPAGLIDVQSLGNGRALAIVEFGRVFTTIDRGANWNDRTARLSAPPMDLHALDDELWIRDDNGKIFKLDKSGDLIPYDRLPEQSLKNKFPARWRGPESPLRTALKRGVSLDQNSALVAEAGDIWKVDLRSGALLSKIDFTPPPAARCQGLRTIDDIVFVCAGGGSSIVISGPLSGERFKSEKSFGVEGPFYSNDEGSLVLGAPCTAGKSSPFGACVRKTDGEWDELSLDPAPIRDADIDLPAAQPTRLARWIPRTNAMPLAILVGAGVATHDPLNNKNTLWKGLALEELIRIADQNAGNSFRGNAPINSSWTAAPDGSLWGWLGTTRSISVDINGSVHLSPYPFDSGFPVDAHALMRTRDGRFYQSSDHGRSFLEVQAPPTSSYSLTNQQACSAVGCDFGNWLRIGWPSQAPLAKEEEGEALPPAPVYFSPPMPELICNSKGEQKSRQLPASPVSPEDLGLGAIRLPFSGELPNGDSISYTQISVSRELWHPARGDMGGTEGTLRVMLHGFGIEFTDNSDFSALTPSFVVLGPNRNPGAFQRTLSFVEPFDTSFSVRKVNYGLNAMASALRASGNSIGNILNTDGLNLQAFIPILSAEPSGGTDYLFNVVTEAGEIYGSVGGGASPKVKFWAARQGTSSPISAIMLSSDEIAVLSFDTDNRERVFSLKAGSISPLFELPEAISNATIAANPDSLALGPQKTLAILRTPSGTRPASANDPALLLKVFPQSPSSAPSALAEWSKLTPADDPACQQDKNAFRSILNTSAPWLKVRGGGRFDGEPQVMSARVAWSQDRVCLEALEIPERREDLPSGIRAETIIVAQFTPKRLAARGFVTRGAEMNHPLSCSIVPPQTSNNK